MTARRPRLAPGCAILARYKPKFTGHWHCVGGNIHTKPVVPCGLTALLGRPARGFEQTARGGMTKKLLVSVVDDDQFFRESMRRLMRSLAYTAEAFASAADFLASPRLPETACLIADVNMPAMTGIELYRHLIGTGRAIPTILVTAYPQDVDRIRALNDGVVCYLQKPVDEQHLKRCLHAALRLARRQERPVAFSTNQINEQPIRGFVRVPRPVRASPRRAL